MQQLQQTNVQVKQVEKQLEGEEESEYNFLFKSVVILFPIILLLLFGVNSAHARETTKQIVKKAGKAVIEDKETTYRTLYKTYDYRVSKKIVEPLLQEIKKLKNVEFFDFFTKIIENEVVVNVKELESVQKMLRHPTVENVVKSVTKNQSTFAPWTKYNKILAEKAAAKAFINAPLVVKKVPFYIKLKGGFLGNILTYEVFKRIFDILNKEKRKAEQKEQDKKKSNIFSTGKNSLVIAIIGWILGKIPGSKLPNPFEKKTPIDLLLPIPKTALQITGENIVAGIQFLIRNPSLIAVLVFIFIFRTQIKQIFLSPQYRDETGKFIYDIFEKQQENFKNISNKLYENSNHWAHKFYDTLSAYILRDLKRLSELEKLTAEQQQSISDLIDLNHRNSHVYRDMKAVAESCDNGYNILWKSHEIAQNAADQCMDRLFYVRDSYPSIYTEILNGVKRQAPPIKVAPNYTSQLPKFIDTVEQKKK